MLSVSGFESARSKVTVDYADHQMIGFVGPNASGKSLLAVWAPYWLLFDKVRARTKDEVISPGHKFAWGTFVFEHGGAVYKVERKLPRTGRPEATLSYRAPDGRWVMPAAALVKDTNASIVALLGMDADTADNTFIAKQGEYGKFAGSTPSDRRKVLTSILGLTGYVAQFEIVRDRIKVVEAERVGVVATVSAIRDQQEHMDDDADFWSSPDEELRERLSAAIECEADIDRQLADLTAQAQMANALVGSAQAAIDQFTAIENARGDHLTEREARLIAEGRRARTGVTEAEGRHRRCVEAEAELADLLPRIEAGEAVLSRQNDVLAKSRKAREDHDADDRVRTERIRSLDSEKAEVLDRIGGLNKAAACCFTRGQSLSATLLASLLKEQNKAVVQLTAERTRIGKAADDAAATLTAAVQQLTDAHNAVRRTEDRLQTIRADIATWEALVRRAVDEKAALDARQAELTALTTQIESARNEAAEFVRREPPAALTKALADALRGKDLGSLVARRNELNAARPDGRELARMRREVSRRESAVTARARLADKLTVATDARDALIQEIGDLTLLRQAFGPSGVPAMILAGGLAEIESIANQALAGLSRGTLQLAISSQRQSIKGAVSEEIYLEVDTPDGTRDYRTLSGGQQFRVDLAVRIALTKSNASHGGAALIRTFIIDEGWGALDADGVQDALEALTTLSSDFTVLTVSHIDAVKAGLPAIIEVSMETGTTVATSIAGDGALADTDDDQDGADGDADAA